MRFDVRLTEEATENVREIRDWLADRSIDGAFNWLDAFEDARRRLSESAGSFGRAPEDDWFEEELKQHMFQTQHGNRYRIVYLIRGSTVYIMAVRGFGEGNIPTGALRPPE